MKKSLIVSVVALAAVSVAVTAAVAKPAKSSADGGHLRPAARPEVVGPLGDAGSPGARRGVQEGRRLVRDHQRRR